MLMCEFQMFYKVNTDNWHSAKLDLINLARFVETLLSVSFL